MAELSLLPVGVIRKAHGIRGEVSVEYHARSPDLLRDGIFLRHGDAGPVFYRIDGFRAHHSALLLRLDAVRDRTAAENLRGHAVLIPEDRLPEPGDAPYLYQIMGLTVIASDERGGQAVWGTISAVGDAGGQEIWTISREGEADVLFPAADQFVLGFDLANRCVRIAPPPGLFALYRP